MIQVTAEDNGKVERALVLVLENFHRARSFRRADHDFIIAPDEPLEDALRQAKSPVATPAPELLPIVERNRIIIAMIVVQVASQFLQTHCSAKALREPNHPKRMGSAVINRAAIFDDSGLLNIPGGRNH